MGGQLPEGEGVGGRVGLGPPRTPASAGAMAAAMAVTFCSRSFSSDSRRQMGPARHRREHTRTHTPSLVYTYVYTATKLTPPHPIPKCADAHMAH